MSKRDEDIIVCRCEDVTLADIRKAIGEGATTMDEIKRITRAGMGPCQGRTCRLLVAAELSRYLGKPLEQVMPSTYRPPVKAVKLGDLADMDADPEEVRED
ncbi:MAG TPA: (2Fe-2S)-binding protein [Firmicutes bacterium]|uniref:(2Fe-2S)-binding protein n=1 Tax=Candidatus Fermentithermobacillus carboniphilus TaxID=3085328 RepID=A0AAT9LDL1_9FIRM|nr:MAG: (2Fe-2S)-binding protein [Candidatus Fermentithermobacillus carboniphilus]HHW17550.1 (2Fe-2S)-binding protein [Candidatus Fermentithermobacillaceae bacterium]